MHSRSEQAAGPEEIPGISWMEIKNNKRFPVCCRLCVFLGIPWEMFTSLLESHPIKLRAVMQEKETHAYNQEVMEL